VHLSTLEARVVRNADSGEHGHLLAAQPRHPAATVRREADLFGRDPRSARG
jgi:hypothetical protein